MRSWGHGHRNFGAQNGHWPGLRLCQILYRRLSQVIHPNVQLKYCSIAWPEPVLDCTPRKSRLGDLFAEQKLQHGPPFSTEWVTFIALVCFSYSPHAPFSRKVSMRTTLGLNVASKWVQVVLQQMLNSGAL